MPTAKVYGNKPDTGPKQLSAQAACDTINQNNPTWLVTFTWTEDATTYKSAVATKDDLDEAVKEQFPGYNVS